MISGKTKLAGFFASPATHSLSPMMQNAAFKHCGIDAVYLAFEVDGGKHTDIKHFGRKRFYAK